MAFPTDKTNAVDNTTDVLAKHINNLEDKVGIDSSADASSLDYKVAQNTEKVSFDSTSSTKLGTIEEGADVTDTANVDSAGATMNTDTTLAGNGYLLDEDDLTSDSATKVASQQSIKAYIDDEVVSLTVNPNVGTGDGSTDDTTILNAFLTAQAGKTVRIPPGNYKVSGTIAILANTTVFAYGARIFDTTTHRYLVTMASGSNLFGLELEGVDHSVIDSDGRGISIVGADSTHDITDITIRDCYIHDIGFYGIYNEFTETVKVSNIRMENIGYGGFMGLSVEDVHFTDCTIDTVEGNGANGYGIEFTRQANDSNTTTYPLSTNCSVIGCEVKNIPEWSGIGAHAGQNIRAIGNYVYNCKLPIRFGGATGDAGVAFSASNNCIANGNTVHGTGAGDGIGINGSTATQGVGNIISNNTIIGAGNSGTTTNGGIYSAYNDNIVISGNNVSQAYENGIAFYYKNEGFSCTGNTIIDVQSVASTSPACIVIRSEYNTGVISGNSMIRDNTGLNTYVSVIGIEVVTNTNNELKIGQNYNTCTNAITGHKEDALFQDGMNAKASVYLSADQTGVASATFTLVEFDSVRHDVGSDFNTTTHQFTTSVAGYYDIKANLGFTGTEDAAYYGGAIYVNGSRVLGTWEFWHASFAGFVSGHIGLEIYVPAGQTIDLRAYTSDACSIKDDCTSMSISLQSI